MTTKEKIEITKTTVENLGKAICKLVEFSEAVNRLGFIENGTDCDVANACVVAEEILERVKEETRIAEWIVDSYPWPSKNNKVVYPYN